MLDQRKSLYLIVIILLVSSLVYLSHLYSRETQPKTDASYLTNEQTFFDANTTYDPFVCDCSTIAQNISSSLPSEPITLPDENQNTQDIEIPDHLPPPPAALMKKIKANLLENRVLVVATANFGMRHHVYNWIESLKRTGQKKFLIFCFDQKLYDHLKAAGYSRHASMIPDIWFHTQVEADFKTYFSKEYRIITHSKTLVVQQLLYLDINVFFSDVDIIWLRPNIVDYVNTLMQMRQETHVLFQQEGMNQQEVNSGFYLMRPSLEMKRLLAETIAIQDANDAKTQQGAMNMALDKLNLDLRTGSVVLLDALHFPNGFVYFTQDLPNKHGIKPFIIHANYLVGEEKKTKLKEYDYWYLNETWLDQIDTQLELQH
ncbi:UDP-galactose:fucoside alpha-3-galactosyltransferase [Choanephora cucurbitarum]|uniref:UDP-galactose:fucoside alpha-3-galactosyltransferase n=1 Tax=Choanephora cucurbitarum TaxID=101091 RepID=A0A1C7N4M0_9FUNG|nr:UDP-galactose:fucoside alpha-3-galactosyltransferase [Choanephora cucurbitarum]